MEAPAFRKLLLRFFTLKRDFLCLSSGAKHAPLVSDLSHKAYTLGLPVRPFPGVGAP